ncbi:hypothetical protein HanIR_Chr11g0509311 [Helianthus annuus]|nr:hypothetical protein HanIR_Chr11g0509311 [Helianthus annuus]
MARSVMLTFLAVGFLLLNSLTFKVLSRSMVDAERVHHIRVATSETDKELSPGRKGHEPSSMGHGYTNYKSLAAIKNSGPSPGGKGHGFRNYETVSSPCHTVERHGVTRFKNCDKTKDSGQSDIPNLENLGNIKNSGPSSGGRGH